jgi:hypothetical protein
MSILAGRLLELHDALTDAGLPHAFGGAIALSYCTPKPRAARDLDVNVLVGPELAGDVLAALPAGVSTSEADLRRAEAEGQVRLSWQDTSIDVFLNVHPFHQQLAGDVRQVDFHGRPLPVLPCATLAVLKVLIGRRKDWADVEQMLATGAIDLTDTLARVAQIIAANDPALARLRALPA